MNTISPPTSDFFCGRFDGRGKKKRGGGIDRTVSFPFLFSFVCPFYLRLPVKREKSLLGKRYTRIAITFQYIQGIRVFFKKKIYPKLLSDADSTSPILSALKLSLEPFSTPKRKNHRKRPFSLRRRRPKRDLSLRRRRRRVSCDRAPTLPVSHLFEHRSAQRPSPLFFLSFRETFFVPPPLRLSPLPLFPASIFALAARG